MKINKKRLFWIIAIALFLIFFHYTNILSPIENLVFKLTSPVRNYLYNISRNMGNFFYLGTHYEQIKSENENIKNQLNNLIIDKIYIKNLEIENESLKQALNYKNNSNKNLLFAKVTPGFYMETYNVIVLDKGSNDGVEIGMPAIYGNGIIVGKVIGVESEKSQVLLLSDKNSVTTVFLEGAERLSGVIRGDLDYGLQMDYIPADTDVKINDIIISSGLEEKIPKGLIIGQVREVIFNDGDFFKKAIISPSIDYRSIDFVNVILN